MRAERHARSNKPASAQEALKFAEALARASSRVLADALVGVVLHGSLVLGDYLPGRSDVDLLGVVERRLTDRQQAAVAGAVVAARPRALVRVDLHVVTRAVAGAPGRLPLMEAYLTIRDRRKPSVLVEEHDRDERDLVVEFSICRARGRSILGPGPAELIGEVPRESVLEVGDAQLADWQAIGDDPRYAELTVLTACRIWRFAEERQHCSKDAAGKWALRRDPSLAVVRDALRQRHNDPTHPIDARRVQDLLAFVRGRVAAARVSA